ncbi:MAG TPA: molecular chaperone DnaJ [Planctomycetaceae bacterium]|nr:molecular chaperone DnaJ [Planctomycetaceae bacterium]
MDLLENRFAKVLSESGDALRLCVVAILSWIASSDGDVDDDEKELLAKFLTKSESQNQVAIEVGQRGSAEGLRLACQVITQMNAEQRELLVVLSMGMCLADGYLKPSESHILLFLVDLTGIGFHRLNQLFFDATGENFPDTSDVSSAVWWNKRQSQQSSTGATHSQKTMESFAILGLNSNATIEEIKAAYLRLASIHHPDRFSSLGPEAVEAASKSFRRIKDAFDYLMETQ